jgi:hypothetical protein
MNQWRRKNQVEQVLVFAKLQLFLTDRLSWMIIEQDQLCL